MPPAQASNAGGPDSLGLPPELMARLDRLAFRSRRNVVGSGAGQRLSPRPGTSAEFSDFRTYVAGDDYRRLDWNAYARLDRLLLRLYLGEEDLSVHLFVDVSASMRYGRPPKDTAAVRIAGALAYVGLAGLDRVALTGFADRVTAGTRPLRGRQSWPRLSSALGRLGSGTDTDFSCLHTVAARLRPGISVILSDFLTASDPSSELGPALAALRSRGQQVVLLQVLAPQEIDPDVAGDVALTDVETGARVEVTVTPTVLDRYRRELADQTARLVGLARAHGALWHRIRSDQPVDLLVMDTFRRIGLLS